MLPIILANINEELVIKKVTGNKDVVLHIKNLGITEGSIVKIITKSSGNIILQVKDSRLAVSSDLAKKIYV